MLPLGTSTFERAGVHLTSAQSTRQTATYRRLKAYLDGISAIDTHDHLAPFDSLLTYATTDSGYGMTLWGVLGAHYGWVNPLPAWKPAHGGSVAKKKRVPVGTCGNKRWSEPRISPESDAARSR